jgi:hypothetical protein
MLHEIACADRGLAFSLWREGLADSGLPKLVHAAVLAANAHNSQPWRFSLLESGMEVRADLDRHLGSFDPFRREMHQSLGCAIENLVQAAPAQGLMAHVEAFSARLPPKGDETLAARVRFTAAAVREPELFSVIIKRHTHRGAYDTSRSLPSAVRAELSKTVDNPQVRLVLLDGTRRAELGKLIVQATRQIVADREMAAGNAKWFRFRNIDVQEHRDGLTLGANVVSPLMAAAARLLPSTATIAPSGCPSKACEICSSGAVAVQSKLHDYSRGVRSLSTTLPCVPDGK